MTDKDKLLIETLVLMDRHSDHTSNLRYAILHTDGAITPFSNTVCWARVYQCIGISSSCRPRDKPYTFSEARRLGEEGYLTSLADIDKIIIKATGPYPEHESKGWVDEYLSALKVWLSMYEQALVPATFEERVEHGIILDVAGGRLTRDQYGAFLVGFRNLWEQRYFKLFNELLKAGVAPKDAAVLNQFFVTCRDGELIRSRGYHCIWANQAVHVREIALFLEHNPLFNPHPDQEKSETHGALEWNCALSWAATTASAYKSDSLTSAIKPVAIVRTDEYDEVIVTYNSESLVPKLKELFNV